jgi:hypothetical protein
MNASPSTDTQTDRIAALALWRVAEAFMHVLAALFGDPGQVAAQHTLTLKAHQLLASWLRAGEAMMRRLLLIEAAAHAKPNTRPLLRAPRKRTRKLMTFTPDAPEKWRVSFRCFASNRGLSPSKAGATPVALRQAQGSHVRFRSAWPIAERYEALLRVFNDPGAYARRLARRLHASPHRLRELLRASPEASDRVDRFSDFTDTARRCWNTS